MTAREKWNEAYRMARIIVASNPSNPDALARLKGNHWHAYLIIRFKRDAADPLNSPPAANLMAKKIIEEIMQEEIS